jgi:protein SDA1
MMFGMVERGMDGEVVGDKGKVRAAAVQQLAEKTASTAGDAMWAIILTKELWKKGVW